MSLIVPCLEPLLKLLEGLLAAMPQCKAALRHSTGRSSRGGSEGLPSTFTAQLLSRSCISKLQLAAPERRSGATQLLWAALAAPGTLHR